MVLLYNNGYTSKTKLKKDVYPILAKKYKKSINNIKTNIINACDLMYYDCQLDIIEKYFGLVYNEKPTPKYIIATILEKLKGEC